MDRGWDCGCELCSCLENIRQLIGAVEKRLVLDGISSRSW
jgi:hypothetical protein